MQRGEIARKLIVINFLLAFMFVQLQAANRYSVATGNWNATSTWSATSGGAPGASVPIAGDVVYIEGGRTVTVNIASACATVNIASGSTLAVGGFNFTVSSATNISGTLSATNVTGTKSLGAVTFTGGTFNNTSTNNPFSITSLTLSNSTISGTRTAIFNISGTTILTNGTTNTIGNITMNVTGLTTVNGTAIFNNTGGTKTFNGGLTVSNGTLNFSAGETINLSDLTLAGATITSTTPATIFGRFLATGNLAVTIGTTNTLNPAQLTINGTTTIDGTLNVNSTIGTKTFVGLVTIGSNGNWNNTVNEAYTIRGGITNNGTFTAGNGNYTLNTTATQTFNGTISLATLTINTPTNLTNNGTLTVSTGLAGTGRLTQGVNTTLRIADSGTFSLANLVANASGNTVEYYFMGNQTVRTGGTTTAYHHLILSGSGTKTITGLTTVNGNFTTTTSSSLLTTTGGNLTIAGNLDIGAGTTVTVGAFNLTVTGTTTVSGIHAHTSTTGTKTHNGDVTINPGGSWTNAANEGFTFNGNFQNNGTLTAGTGATAIYNFAGSNKTLSGTSGIAIPYTTVNGTYTNQTTTTVATALSGTGTLTQADNVTLNIGGTSGISNLMATAMGNTVNYTGVAQTVKNTNYNHLELSGSNIKTMPASSISIAGNFTTAGTAIANSGAGYIFGGNITLGAGTTFNAGNFSHSLAGNWNNNGTTFNPSTGTFTFNGGSSQNIGGTTNTSFNCFTVNNAAGIVLGRAVNAACVTLSNGLVTTTTTNLLSITGTTPTAITGSASSYVNGPLARNLPVTSGVTYSFPIGKSGFNPLDLVNTNTTGATTIQTEVFDANCGGTAGTGMSTLATNRYWEASFVSGSGNFNNTQIRLTESGLDTEDAIGQSTTSNGTYDKISTSPPSGSTITSDAITSLGFFVIGKRPAISIAATQDGAEGGTNGEFTLTTSYQFAAARTINIAITGTAVNGTDYTTINTTFTFPANSSTATLTIPVTDDYSIEPSETVIITIQSGTGYSVGSPSSATINITDNDVAGITVNPTSGLITTEAGGQATFTIVLNTQPTNNVTIGLSTNDNTEGTVSPSSVTFTNGNWNSAQTVTITGANDFVDDGDIAYTIVTAAATSSDGNYNSFNASDVSVTNTDNDVAGITVNPTSGLTTTEAGGLATFTIVLNSQPTADVSISLSSDDTSEGDISPSSVTFTDANWNSAQTITITGADDFMVDGNIAYNIVTAAATSTDGLYNGIDASDVSVTNNDNDVAGFTVTPTTGLQTSEAGGQATFTIVLTSQPSNDVAISITSDDTSEGTVSPSSVTFTNGNWNSPQTITITGVDGPMADGDITYHIVTGVASSGDANYNGLNPDDVTVVNLDNDVAGISINPVAGLVTTEAGGTASFTIVLNTQPTDNVTIGISSSDLSEGTVSPSSVTFTDTNWNLPQTVTLTGVNDDIDDGNIAYTAITAAATSSDSDYNGINPADVSATNTDNDVAGITVSAISGNTTEAGGTATFSIRLNSEPTADVTIGLSSNDTSEGTVSPTSVTFTAGNWNSNQTITITGINDAVDDGNIVYSIVTAPASSADGLYNGMNASDVSVANTDDDTAGITVNPTSGLTTTEAGGQASFTVVLNSEPTANVVIDIVSNDPTEGTVSSATLTFTSGNWNSAQTITITGQNDDVMDGNIAYSILTTVEPGGDALYNAINPLDVSATNTDNDVAGITVNPSTGLVTTEAGGTATFNVRLNSEPTANVVIGISSSNVSEGTVSPSSLTFTSANWSSNQTVTITGVNDFVDDGDIAYTVVTAAATSLDGNYNGMDATDVSVSNTDNDVAGITVNPTSGLTTTEAGGTAQFTVVLTSEPTANVTIGISSSDVTEGTVSASSLTFTNGDWNVAQTVTITGVNDFSIDGNIAYTIETAPATSTDGLYNGINASDVSVTNTDDDVAQIVVNPTSGLNTDEDGASDTFTIELTSIPTADVTIAISTSDPSEGSVSTSSVVLNSSNWNVPQTVTVTGVNDDIDDDDIAYTIDTGLASSSDGNYNGINPDNVSVTNADNDDAGITVTPTTGLVTSENLTSDNFTIVLTSQPTANVQINLSVNDNSEGQVSPSSVTFTSGNWSTPQTVTVTGKNDNQIDGDIIYSVETAPATSSDPKYSGMNADDVEVTNLDNDSPGVTVSTISGNTTEAGGTATFTVVLITQPSDDVTIPVSSSNTAEGTVSTSSLTFTSGNWDTPQTITVTGVNDASADGDMAYSILVGTASSDDNDYDGIDPADVSVTNTDLTPTITLSTNPTVCSGTTTANLAYTATTKTPNQYVIDFDATAEAQGFADVAYTALPSSPIAITVPAAAAGGTYNASLVVRNSSYSACISPIYSISVSVNAVTAGSIGADQNFYGVANPAELTQTGAATGSGTLSYRWESSTTNCSAGFAAIGGATSATYDPPSGLTETTYFRRIAISTLNGVACETNSNCVTVTVNLISIVVSATSASDCPELDPAKGFEPNNNGPYNPGATDLVFEVEFITPSKEWQFTFDVSEAENIAGFTVQSVNASGTGYSPSSINAATGTFQAIPSSATNITITVRVSNIPGVEQDVVFNVSNVKYTDNSFSENYTNKLSSISIKAMPAIGDFN
jgi:hypothetical protein